MSKHDKDEYKQKIKAETNELSKKLEQGVNDVFRIKFD